MLVTTLKQKAFEAAKEKKEVEKNILRFVLGEVQNKEMKQKIILSDDDVVSLIRKVVDKNHETLSYVKENQNQEIKDKLNLENEILNQFIPKTLSCDEIIKSLDQETVKLIKNAKNDGQSMGLAMKFFKSSEHNVLGIDVKEAVSKIRV